MFHHCSALICFSLHRVSSLEDLSLSISRMVNNYLSQKHIHLHACEILCANVTLSCKTKRSANCLNTRITVLHTGKRWFIICPVEETPTSSQDTPSDATTTQSPGSSATTQPADSGTARPTVSRGDFAPTQQFRHNI